MPEAKIYLQNELHEKATGSIIGYFRLTQMGKQESALCAVGSSGLLGPNNCMLVLADRILCMHFLKMKTPLTVSFLDFAGITAEPSENLFSVYLQLKNGERCETGIRLSASELNRLSSFFAGYRDKGAWVAQNYRDRGITTHYLIHKEEEDREAQYEREKAKRQEETQKRIEASNQRSDIKIQQLENKVKELNEKRNQIFESGLKEDAVDFPKLMDLFAQLPYFELKATYCGGSIDAPKGLKHTLYLIHSKQGLGIYPPLHHQMIIPYSQLKGAMIRRADGIPRDQLTDEQKYYEYGKEQLFYLDIHYTWQGKDAVITYSDKQTKWADKNNLFGFEYVINNLPRISEMHASEREEQEQKDREVDERVEKSHQRVYEVQDTRPDTNYRLTYLGGYENSGGEGIAELTLDRTTLKIVLPGRASILHIPLRICVIRTRVRKSLWIMCSRTTTPCFISISGLSWKGKRIRFIFRRSRSICRPLIR